MTIKTILFDKDGTLLDYHATWTSINLQAAEFAAGGDPALARRLLALADADPDTGRADAGGLFAAGNSAEIADAWLAECEALTRADLTAGIDSIFTHAMRTAVPIQGGYDAIRALHAQGYKMGVASSDSAEAIRVFLQSAGLTPYFQFIAGYDSGYGHKPDPGALYAFCHETRTAPAAAAMVGDNIQDLQLARSGGAGLAVGVLSGTGTEDKLRPLADVIIPDISHLERVIGR
ncbi:HAD family hydrolase [Roseovarius dicentrarchi]|uniref:HAD family hydrolase n=1 Tax=Roseovarius dicentrarchi TaxID=2250573 RepID=UPI000DE8792F|nr:HAD family hydrolase [Roseovarius dicentrarchi]